MTMLRVFKSTIPSINYIFGNGKPAIFQDGEYRTDIEWEIKELENEISLRHPHIFIDANRREVDSSMVDPVEVFKAKIIAEYEAKRQLDAAGTQDMGKTVQGPLIPANSRDVAVAAAGGNLTPASVASLVKIQTAQSAAPAKV